VENFLWQLRGKHRGAPISGIKHGKPRNFPREGSPGIFPKGGTLLNPAQKHNTPTVLGKPCGPNFPPSPEVTGPLREAPLFLGRECPWVFRPYKTLGNTSRHRGAFFRRKLWVHKSPPVGSFLVRKTSIPCPKWEPMAIIME